jgi:hypothetical protein
MYKWSMICLTFAIASVSIFGGEKASSWPERKASGERSPSAPEKKIKPILEGKMGYFFFSDKKMRKIYDRGGLDGQISGSYPIWKWLQIYGSVEYLSRHGKSLGGGQHTRIWEVPLSLGLKPVVRICDKIHYYFTLGPRYIFAHVHNNSPFVDREVNANGWGGFANTGFNFFPIPHFCIDVFGEYSYSRIHFHPHKQNVYGNTVQVGGFVFGAGLGYAF